MGGQALFVPHMGCSSIKCHTRGRDAMANDVVNNDVVNYADVGSKRRNRAFGVSDGGVEAYARNSSLISAHEAASSANE